MQNSGLEPLGHSVQTDPSIPVCVFGFSLAKSDVLTGGDDLDGILSKSITSCIICEYWFRYLR